MKDRSSKQTSINMWTYRTADSCTWGNVEQALVQQKSEPIETFSHLMIFQMWQSTLWLPLILELSIDTTTIAKPLS